MGATNFRTVSKGATAKEAFDAAVSEALYEYGHGGYSGTIAEKRSFKLLSVPAGKEARAFVEEIEENDSHGYGEKYGPALCVSLGDGKFLFFGLAPC